MSPALQRFAPLLVFVAIGCASCRQPPPAASDIQLELRASDERVGETTLLVAVTDREGKAIAEAGKLSLRGDMNHAGMKPVFAEAEKAVDGLFRLAFEWTMAGGWIVEASLTLPSGEVARETFTFEILPAAGESAMAEMDHSAGDHPPGETSAVYMRVTNRGASERVIVAARSDAAERVEFHRTVVEAEFARMEALDSLVIPAGETLELRPGGAHIMLGGLAADLLPQSRLSLQLECGSGEVYDLEIQVADMPMGDRDDAVEFGDLVFSSRWARPARAGGADH